MDNKGESALNDDKQSLEKDKKIPDVEEGEVSTKHAKNNNNEETIKSEGRDDNKGDKEKKKDKKSKKDKKENREKSHSKDKEESSKKKAKKSKKEDKKYDKERSSSRSRSRSRDKKRRRSPSPSKKAKYNRKRSDSNSKRRSRSRSDEKGNRKKYTKRRSSSSSRKRSYERDNKGKETRKRSRSPNRTDRKRDKDVDKQSTHDRKDRSERNELKESGRDTKRRNEAKEQKKEIDDEPIDEESLKKIESQFAMVEEDEERIAKERREQRRRLLEQFGKMNDEENKKKNQAAMEEEKQHENNKLTFKEEENKVQQDQKVSSSKGIDAPINKSEVTNSPKKENQVRQQVNPNLISAMVVENKPMTENVDQMEESKEESKDNEEINNRSKRVIGEHKHDADKERYIKMIENMREKLQKEEEELREERDKEEEKNKEEQSKSKVQDQEFDMFCETPETLEAEKIKMPIVKGEQQSCDDENGYYRAQIGEIMNGKYQITAKLGKGVFGNVFKGLDTTTNQEIAIKVLKSDEIYTMSGLKEKEMLTMLNEADRHNKRHIIRLLDSFDHLKHLVLVFELMEMDLRSAIKTFGKKLGLSLESVRSYARQLFISLAHLRKYKIIHADLKPDNILVTNNKKTLKLSDFGSAFPLDENTITPYLVARYYRAPEIILGCPYDMSVDVWSAACTIFELYTGKILFPGRDNNDMLKYILQTKGMFNNKMLKRGEFSKQYFDRRNNFLSTETDPVTKEKYVRPLPIGNKITRDIGNMLNDVEIDLSEEDRKKVAQLKDLLERCLTLDPNRRLTPEDVLKHQFINYNMQKLPLDQNVLKHAF